MKKSKRLGFAFVGFVDGKPDLDALRPKGGVSTDGYCVLYRLQREGRRYYQDVRRVEIWEAPSSLPTSGEKS